MRLLEVRDLKVYFKIDRGDVRAVDSVDLDLDRGEVIGLAGESGSGKSTIGYALLRIIPPPGRIVGGRVLFKGTDIMSLEESTFGREYRWKKLSMVFQASMNSFTPVFKIGEQIEETLEVHGYTGDKKGRVEELLKMVRLDPSVANKYPHELSGGQKQRAMIALALSMDPEVLIADEPTTALDVVTQMGILNLLKRLKDEKGISVIFITHDLALLSEVADRVYIMYAGEIVEHGSSERIYKSPKHPYTRALMGAVPSIDKRSLTGIPGFMPDLANPPPGCRFHPRCPAVMDICKREKPKIKQVEGDDYSACWLY